MNTKLSKLLMFVVMLAMAVSVMSMSAWATSDSDFEVKLAQHTGGTAVDRDGDSIYEINADDTITYDIIAKYKGEADSVTVVGFSFEYAADSGDVHTKKDVTIHETSGNADVVIKGQTINMASTQLAPANTYAYSGADAGNITLTKDTAVTVGTITFDFSGDDVPVGEESNGTITNTNVMPTIDNIKFQLLGDGTTYTVSASTCDFGVYVNPMYEVTVKHFKPNTTTGVAELKTESDQNHETTFTYTFSNGDDDDLTAENTIPGYTFRGWMVTAEDSTHPSSTWKAYVNTGNNADGAWNMTSSFSAYWTAFDTADQTTNVKPNDDTDLFIAGPVSPATASVIGSSEVGNITLTPVFTADEFTVTFVAQSGSGDANFGQDTNESNITQRTAEYTIETIASGDPLDLARLDNNANAPLARTGFEFVKWVSSGTDTVTEGYAWPAEITPTSSSGASTTAYPKHYGAVTLTAEWKVAGYFAKLNYQYGGSNNVLVLFAVPSGANSNYSRLSTYKYRTAAADAQEGTEAEYQKMFIIPATTTGDSANHSPLSSYMAVSKDRGLGWESDDLSALNDLNGAYTVYAYIAPTATASYDDIMLVDDNTANGNDTLVYNGNVDGSNDGKITVADFGNVDSLLDDSTNTSIFEITSNSNTGVKARLLADMDDTAAHASVMFGSIKDVVAIYNAMGYSITGDRI